MVRRWSREHNERRSRQERVCRDGGVEFGGIRGGTERPGASEGVFWGQQGSTASVTDVKGSNEEMVIKLPNGFKPEKKIL
jgi:hypothetical protein